MKLIIYLTIIYYVMSLNLKSQLRDRLRQCPCDVQGCPSCMLANTLKNNIEEAEQANLEDAEQQRKYQQIVELQTQLFLKAQKYAEDAQKYEEKAQDLANQLNIAANKAQENRNNLKAFEQQAKNLALKTMQTNLVHKPLFQNIHVVPVGIKTKQIIQNYPEYQINIQAYDHGNDLMDE